MKDKLNQKTKVIFRLWEKEVIALFPRDPGTFDPATCSSYMHVGQHGATRLFSMICNSRLAKPKEYRVLARELRKIGYRLDICKRTGQTDYRIRERIVRI